MAEDIVVFTDAPPPPPPPPGKRRGDDRRRTVVLKNVTNLELKAAPRPSDRDHKEKAVLAVIENERNRIEELIKEKAVLKKEIAERDKIIKLSRIEFQKLRGDLQQLQRQNMVLALENSQISGELRAGNEKLKVLEHELRCVRGVLSFRKLEFPMEITVCEEAGGSSQVDKHDNSISCRTDVVCLSKDTSTRERVQTKEMSGDRRRQSRGFKMVELESTKDVVKAIEQEKSENRRISLRRQSSYFETERMEPTEDIFHMDDAEVPVLPQLNDAEFPVFAELKGEKNDDLLIPLLLKTDLVEGNMVESAALESNDLPGRPTRRAAQKIQSYKETPLNRKLRRPD